MDINENSFGVFLSSRRARLSPEQAGLPSGGTRRVAGLRRSEVAMLAGVSVEYLARLERGAVRGVSEAVLDALARALQLDEVEREHLIHLAQVLGAGAVPRQRPVRRPVIRASMQLVLDSVSSVPAVIRNGRGDILTANELGRALYSEMYVQPARPVNHARFVFLDARARRFYPEWDRSADDMVALLRAEAGRDPYDKALTGLVGDLSTRSSEFRSRWAAQNVTRHVSGEKHFHHPVVGDLRLNYEALILGPDEGLTMLVYPPTPGTPYEDAIRLLALWQATSEGVPADTIP
ncbi:helix-turn-helix transcriptional regulator [Rathayibacter sp. VKM Ac-2754]|uniref:helix-turn-helix transcriptional regulator n=1 Tax=Rathayibacter sp. VKM Ac-2754 TaxID=2609251 RepID=UPI001F43B92C|nr:helix-turn-helix transcriptional regulator [Rathayibacter sp. VKM Ac-2754]